MITVEWNGKACHFDDSGLDREAPGHVYGILLSNKFYEAKFLRYIARLRLGGTYLDIGALIGTHTMFFGLHTPASRILAFEPRLAPYERLRKNAELNGLAASGSGKPYVRAFQFGLGTRPGSVEVELDGRDHTLEIRTLDAVLAQEGVTAPRGLPLRSAGDPNRVSLVKIDVEGMELDVLRGATAMLRAHRPRLYIEAHSEAYRDEIALFLKPFGYRWTGRVFNASPTYEFLAPPPGVPVPVADAVATAKRYLPAPAKAVVRKAVRAVRR